MNNPKVIILLTVYAKDLPAYLHLSIDSMLEQTYEPLEILLGIDGPIGEELKQCIATYADNKRITILPFKENRGVAATLNDMIEWGQTHEYQYFARMDADDISLPDRIQLQMTYLLAHPDIDIVGGATNEIDEEGYNRGKINHYPLTPEACFHYFAKRNPVAHPAVIIKQSFFDKAGCLYRPEYRQNQDTMLWFDGLKKGALIANLENVVLNFRVTQDFFSKRRNGLQYAKGLLKDRKIINRELNYGFMATIYAYMLFFFRICPTWIIRMAYKFL